VTRSGTFDSFASLLEISTFLLGDLDALLLPTSLVDVVLAIVKTVSVVSWARFNHNESVHHTKKQ
jgi:hypothetical protein